MRLCLRPRAQGALPDWEEADLPADSGPYQVISQLGVIGFDDETKRMKLISVHPGVTVEDVVENTGFELIIPDEVSETKPPTEVDLRLLREEIDSAGIVIGKK